MRKKILYSILFFTLFLLSTASMIKPVYGYGIGVPEQAIDMEAQFEIKIYDEDLWEDCIGKKGVTPDEIYEGDADVVGARELLIIRDFGDVDKTEGPGDHDFEEIPMVEGVWRDVSPAADDISNGIAGLLQPVQLIYTGMGSPAPPANITTLVGLWTTGVLNGSNLLAKYEKSWEGGILWRDRWFYNEDWETDKDYGDDDKIDLEAEDEWDGWGPIFGDPRDPREFIDQMALIKKDLRGSIDGLQQQLYTMFAEFFQGPATAVPLPTPTGKNFTDVAARDLYNQTNNFLNTTGILTILSNQLGIPLAPAPLNWTLIGGPDLTDPANTAGGDHFYVLVNFLATTLATMYYASDAIPFDQKLEFFLLLTVDQAMPIMTPSADYVARMCKEMNFDDDVLYRLPWVSTGVDVDDNDVINTVPQGAETVFGDDLDGEWYYVWAYVDVIVEGATITFEVEYQEDQADPKDILEGETDPDELDDFEWVTTYNDYGFCGTAWKKGDKIIWQTGSVEQIPGYEIPILLGVSGISILAVVYVIMKKRRR